MLSLGHDHLGDNHGHCIARHHRQAASSPFSRARAEVYASTSLSHLKRRYAGNNFGLGVFATPRSHDLFRTRRGALLTFSSVDVRSDRVAVSNLVPGTPFCVALGDLSHFYAFWIPILCFETLLCALAIIRGYRSWRDNEIKLRRKRRRTLNTSAQTENASGSSGLNVLEILLRDSVGYFIVYACFKQPFIFSSSRTE